MSRLRAREDENNQRVPRADQPPVQRLRGTHNSISFSLDSTVASHAPADAARFASSAAEGPVTL